MASKPATSSDVDTNSPITDSIERHIDAGDYTAPKHFLNDNSPTLSAPNPVYLGISRAMLEDANKRRNWTLLTPEQILNVQTPDSILGIKRKDSDQDLSLEDQYLMRLHATANGGAADGKAKAATGNNEADDPLNQRDLRPAMNSAMNGKQFGRSASGNINFSGASSRNLTANANQGAGDSELSQLFNQSSWGANDQQQPYSAWTSAFTQPSRPKPNQNQSDSWKSFQALLEQSSPAAKMASQIRSPTPAQSDSTSDSFFQKQPQYDPAGRSVDILQDSAALPTGLQPIPSLSGPTFQQNPAEPSWKPQLPPWMRTGPQMR